MANFVTTGLLGVAFAAGVRRTLHPGRAGTWGPLLIGAYGVGLIAAGIFAADPAFSFPVGSPAGIPAELSWHAVVHGIAASTAFLSLTVACFVFVRRFAANRVWGWAAYCALTGVAAVALSPLGGNGGAQRASGHRCGSHLRMDLRPGVSAAPPTGEGGFATREWLAGS